MSTVLVDKNGDRIYKDSIVDWKGSLCHLRQTTYESGDKLSLFYDPRQSNPYDHAVYSGSIDHYMNEYSDFEKQLLLVKKHATEDEYDALTYKLAKKKYPDVKFFPEDTEVTC